MRQRIEEGEDGFMVRGRVKLVVLGERNIWGSVREE